MRVHTCPTCSRHEPDALLEVTRCELCQEWLCHGDGGCERVCHVCRRKGCSSCMKETELKGIFVCEDCENENAQSK